ncbi:Repressor ROX1, partial [Termitomyces sp. J132]
IPRPPNAFILFRSSFIRDHKVTSKVEGNHSNLSKIIGMYWRTLTKEQRNEWEAKAEQALIEHRKRYPDWRFRPATNATVQPKTKIKDGARRGRARKDPPDRAGKEESKESPGKGRTMTRAEEEDSRLTKIAGLLVEGQEGEALERAVEEWEAERQKSRRSVSKDDAIDFDFDFGHESAPIDVGIVLSHLIACTCLELDGPRSTSFRNSRVESVLVGVNVGVVFAHYNT